MFKSRPAKLVLATQLALGLIATVQAEDAAVTRDNNIERIVVTASGFEQKLVDAPASISVVTAEELKVRPYTTLLDAVRDLEGVDIGETRDKTGQGTISMRGMGSDYTLILVDGKRQNNHGDIYPNNFGGNQFGHMPPLETVERIEVVRGPASTLYGADALGGVINIITKKVTNEWMGSVSHSRTAQTDDSFGEEITTDFNVMGPLIPNVLGMSVRGSAYNRMASTPAYAAVAYPNGEVRNRSLGFGAGGKTVDNDSSVLGARLSWTPVDNQAIWFDVDTSTQEYDNSPIINDDGSREYPVGTVDNIDSIWAAGNFCKGAAGTNAKACATNGGTWARRANPRVGYSPTQEFSRDSWSLSHEGKWDIGNSFMSLSYVDTQNHGRTLPFTLAERAQLLTMIDGTGAYADLSVEDRKDLAEETFLPRAKRTMASSQYTFDAKMDMPFELAGQHKTIVGTQVIRGELEDGVFGMESGTPGGVQEHNMWSVFAEDTWDATQDFSITAGLRRDDHQVFGSEMSPRLYGVYTLSPEWTIKGGVSTGYKTPKTTQLYDGVVGFGGQGTSPMFGNSALKPETSTSTEIAAYWEHPDNHNFNITIFSNKFEDKIASQPCGPATGLTCSETGEYADLGYATSSKTVNIDKVTIQGAELAGRWQIIDNVAFRANYTYTDSEQKSGANKGRPLGSSAKHMANLTLDWAATDDLKVFLTSEIRTKRYRTWDLIKDEALYYKAYEVFHLGASFAASDSVTFTARINNLFDQDFTTYDLNFVECDNGDSCVFDANGANGYQASYVDHFNNKDKARNLWVSVNVSF
ncbi:MAG: TonB-dependent receptor [Gammaproteobacteria bacterium]|nr:TonB-dependent receptor [Gammaproteobacteria bacterium]MBU2058691.1 TonB-dependent receptor [Gammaproteobacteria bacterium]MBU2177343.1 TonB-dependent receptor [Gammaproteobacteria bacterium]MBU2246051.1 TonB-dependent receptor [Gammaproteobacteria bacterium]MBU2343957.1 TonB-dependent receptor [Gammaproteobacteria bacterium]